MSLLCIASRILWGEDSSQNIRAEKGFRNPVDLLLHFRDRAAERENRAVVAYLVSSRDKGKI